MRKQCGTWVLLGVIAIVGGAIPAVDAEAGWGGRYFGGCFPYYGYYPRSLYVREYIPYYAQYPPVYYSYPVARPYGFSPYAYPPGIPTPEKHARQPVTTQNPYVPGSADYGASAQKEPKAPLRIINPFVKQPAGAKEASRAVKPPTTPQVVHPTAVVKSE